MLFLAVFVLIIPMHRFRRQFDRLLSNLFLICAIIWLIGAVLYLIGFYNPALSFFAVVPRVVIAASKMFLFMSEYTSVSMDLRLDNSYMTAFSIIHLLAALISFLFMMKFIGLRIKSFIQFKLYTSRFYSLLGKKINIFWDFTESSFLLARELSEEKDNIIVFVHTNDKKSEKVNQTVGLSAVFDIMSLSRGQLSFLDEIKSLVVNSNYDISSHTFTKDEDVFSVLGLKNVKKLIDRSMETNIYFFSDAEQGNLNSALSLLSDSSLKNDKINIYIKCRNSKVNDIYNNYQLYSSDSGKIRLNIIDPAYLSVSFLKFDKESQPVNVVDIDPQTATVSSDFNSLIVGFGNIGLEAFKFLYEFGTFVDKDGHRIPFKCTVIDENASLAEGYVHELMPAISSDEVSFIQTRIDSDSYWKYVNENIKNLNYVIVCLNNDELAIQTAVELYRKALTIVDKRMDNFRIFVKCNSVYNYSRMCTMANTMMKSNHNSRYGISIFGNDKEIFCKELILNNKIHNEEMIFNYVYEKGEEMHLTKEELWEKSFGKEKIDADIKKFSSKGLSYSRYQIIKDIQRKIYQNRTNTYHKYTKLILLGIDDSNSDVYRRYISLVPSRSFGKVTYKDADSNEQTRLLNVAKCEHERWVTSHKILGYTFAQENCLQTMRMKYMTEWDNLSEEIQSYDSNIVDTSIKLI